MARRSTTLQNLVKRDSRLHEYQWDDVEESHWVKLADGYIRDGYGQTIIRTDTVTAMLEILRHQIIKGEAY